MRNENLDSGEEQRQERQRRYPMRHANQHPMPRPIAWRPYGSGSFTPNRIIHWRNSTTRLLGAHLRVQPNRSVASNQLGRKSGTYADFVEHCATRWESGKAMLVCIDKITCARMWQ